jgi:hypothetical protein
MEATEQRRDMRIMQLKRCGFTATGDGWKHRPSSYPLHCDAPYHCAPVCLTCLAWTSKFCLAPWRCRETLGLKGGFASHIASTSRDP